jgi:hypothetical protein
MSRGKDVIALTHSPKSIGKLNCQIIWYLPSSGASPCTTHHFEKIGDWPGLLRDVTDFMNAHIVPCQLVSLSIFEEEHPSKDQE